MKQKLLILLTALLAAVSAHAFSYMYEDQTLYYKQTSDTTCKVTSYKVNTKNGAYIIPETVTYNNVEYTVTEIAENAFKNATSITSLVIPETVTSIGKSAFYCCANLETVNLPEGLICIGDYTFFSCSNLKSVVIPEGMTTIGYKAFYGCTRLETITIPESVYSFSSGVFTNCSSLEAFYGKYASDDHRCLINDRTILAFAPGKLTEYTIPKTVTSIGEHAFSECSSLTSVVIPESVTYINIRAFSDCSSLTSVVIPESVTTIYDYAFSGCSSLESVEIPESVTSIRGAAFSNCSSLTSLVIPESVTSIENHLFFGCSSLESVEIPESVTSIGKWVFSYCTSLVYLEIKESITSIGDCTFRDCSIDSIRVYNPDPAEISLGEDVFSFSKRNCYLFVPKGSEELYAEADQWKGFTKINYRVLNDGKPYTAEEDAEEPNVDYIRNFGNTNWQALYLPFAMNYDEWSRYADVAELYNIRGYDTDEDGAIDEVRVEFNRLKEGSSIKPNVPYVIKAKNARKVTFECKDKVVLAAPEEEGTVECSSTKFTYAFHGIYEEKTDVFDTGVYFLSGGNFCQAADETVKLAPYRAYLTITPKKGGYNDDTTQAQAPKRVILVVDGEEETTGIDDKQITTPQDGIYYDLTGRRIANPTTGIYIQNGRKVYIK